MKIFLIFWSIFTLHTTESTPEQLAYDYFMNELFIENYSNENALYFKGSTNAKARIDGPFFNCFDTNKDFESFWKEHKAEESENLQLEIGNYENIRFLKRQKKQNLTLEIYRNVKYKDQIYVYMKVYKPKEFVDYYLIKIDNNIVVDFCLFNETI